MTHDEIEARRRKLQDILEKYETTVLNSSDTRNTLRELAKQVGASTQTVFLNVVQGGSRTVRDAEICELADNIHIALQTASMIDTCRTAAENVRLAENAQAAASKAQRVAFWGVLAAWGAVVANVVVAWIMAGRP